jgi:DsbC/DsbD-like thiol-disulfide interchange protein
MKKNRVILSVLSLLLLPQIGHAASSEWAMSGETRMRLIVAEPQAGDMTIRAALQVDLAAGWKTYWQDPGEAGVPLQLDLTGSQNVALKAILYPAPMRFDDGVTEWAGYKQPVLFPIELQRGDSAVGASIAADVFIGICEEICVPFQTNLNVKVENANASTADQMAVQAAFAALPARAGDTFGVRSIKADGKTVQIETVLKTGNSAPELFLVSPIGWQFGAPKLVGLDGLNARFEAGIFFAPKVGLVEPLAISYTLIEGGSAVTGISSLTK